MQHPSMYAHGDVCVGGWGIRTQATSQRSCLDRRLTLSRHYVKWGNRPLPGLIRLSPLTHPSPDNWVDICSLRPDDNLVSTTSKLKSNPRLHQPRGRFEIAVNLTNVCQASRGRLTTVSNERQGSVPRLLGIFRSSNLTSTYTNSGFSRFPTDFCTR